jgi:hypothetical protein
MKLSEWVSAGAAIAGVERFARLRTKAVVEEIAGGEDPTVYGSAQYPPEAGQMVQVQLYAALKVGLAKVMIQSDPIRADTATESISVQTWPTAARLESRGASEDRQPIALVLDNERVEATQYERKELIELFTAIAEHSAT